MDAIAIRRGDRSPARIDVPRPEPGVGEALVRTLRVGIDGTDREVIAGNHGSFPEGEDHLVVGHEAVGIVGEAPPDADLDPGDAVVPTVRRPPAGGTNEYFERGEPDMAPPGMTAERGIDGAHGFMAEYFTSPVEYLVGLPRALAPAGFLVEPVSVAEKALELASASRSTFTWTPEAGVVLGNGCLGLLALAMLGERGVERTYCVGRRDRPDPTVDVIESLGATYVDSRKTDLADFPVAHEPADVAVEATGHARHAFEVVEALAPGGVAALLGLPDPWEFEVDGGRLHSELVMTNKALVGSVNSNGRHFEAAVDTLGDLPSSLLDDLITAVYPVGEFRAAFDRPDDRPPIKTAVGFDVP